METTQEEFNTLQDNSKGIQDELRKLERNSRQGNSSGIQDNLRQLKTQSGQSSQSELLEKSCIRETQNLSTDADSSTDTLGSACVKKRADSILLFAKRIRNYPPALYGL